MFFRPAADTPPVLLLPSILPVSVNQSSEIRLSVSCFFQESGICCSHPWKYDNTIPDSRRLSYQSHVLSALYIGSEWKIHGNPMSRMRKFAVFLPVRPPYEPSMPRIQKIVLCLCHRLLPVPRHIRRPESLPYMLFPPSSEPDLPIPRQSNHGFPHTEPPPSLIRPQYEDLLQSDKLFHFVDHGAEMDL